MVVYWTLSALVGFPIVYLEQSLGQYTSQGPMNCWTFAPIIRGLGFSITVISVIGSIYYNVIIAWALFMLFASFRAVLPWQNCDYDSWADYRCELQRWHCDGVNSTYDLMGSDGVCYNSTFFTPVLESGYAIAPCNFTNRTESDCLNFVGDGELYRNTSTVIGLWNETLALENGVYAKLSTDEYFYHYVIRMFDNDNVDNIGTPSWGLVLCLLLAWIMVYFCCKLFV